MATFTSTRDLNIRLPGGFEVQGVAGTVHRIPDSLAEEFARDQAPNIPGFAWVKQDEMTAAMTPASISTGGLTATSAQINGAVTATGAIAAASLSATGSIIGAAVTATTARFKGGPWFDVKAFGAAGDNATDDTTAIQAAIDSAATNGGTVWMPAGTYIASQLTLKSLVHLRGGGYEATILKLKNNTNTTLLIGQNFTSLSGTSSAGGIAQWSIADLTIDGNRTSNSAGFGIQVFGYGYTLRNVRIRECASAGIYSEWSSSAGAPSPAYDGMEAYVENVKVHGCNTDGITWNGPHDTTFVGVIVYGAASHGINIQSKGQFRAQLCHVYSVGGNPFRIGAESNLENCIAEGAGTSAATAGVYIGHNNVYWRGGLVSVADTGRIGIEFASSASVCLVDTIILNSQTAVIAGSGSQNTMIARVWSSPMPTLVSGIPSGDSVYRLMTDANRGTLVTTPGVPLSLTSLRNTLGVDVHVYIEGGTCTGTFIDGVRLNNHASPYFVYLPAYHEVSIQYTVAPTWKWIGV